jgi:hypothetical protein
MKKWDYECDILGQCNGMCVHLVKQDQSCVFLFYK